MSYTYLAVCEQPIGAEVHRCGNRALSFTSSRVQTALLTSGTLWCICRVLQHVANASMSSLAKDPFPSVCLHGFWFQLQTLSLGYQPVSPVRFGFFCSTHGYQTCIHCALDQYTVPMAAAVPNSTQACFPLPVINMCVFLGHGT